MSEWYEVLTDYTVEEMLEIIEDALSHGFEFKIENHSIYWRM